MPPVPKRPDELLLQKLLQLKMVDSLSQSYPSMFTDSSNAFESKVTKVDGPDYFKSPGLSLLGYSDNSSLGLVVVGY